MNTESRLHIHMGCGESLQSRRWLLRLATRRDSSKAQRAPARQTQTQQQVRNRS